jgi:hypothetical protein
MMDGTGKLKRIDLDIGNELVYKYAKPVIGSICTKFFTIRFFNSQGKQ